MFVEFSAPDLCAECRIFSKWSQDEGAYGVRAISSDPLAFRQKQLRVFPYFGIVINTSIMCGSWEPYMNISDFLVVVANSLQLYGIILLPVEI